MEKINVLISSAGSTPAISVIKALRKQKELDINIIAVDMDEYSAGFKLADDSCIVPASDDSSFSPKIIKICEDKNISVVIPIIDEELAVFAAEKKAFNDKNIKILVNDLNVVKRANDKKEAADFCDGNDIIYPKTSNTLSAESIDYLGLPLITKPFFGRGSEGIHIINSKEEFDCLPEEYTKDAIGQEVIKGKEYTVDILATPDGEILQGIPRERITVKAGQIFKGRTVNNLVLINRAKEVAKKFGINGPCNVQFIEKDNEFYLIEVNPKFAAGLALTVEAGVNIPLLLIKMVLDKDYRPGGEDIKFKDDLVMARYWQEAYF